MYAEARASELVLERSAGRACYLEQALIDVVRGDDVPIARLTRAIVRCSLEPSRIDFREARRRLAQEVVGIATVSFQDAGLAMALASEMTGDLPLIRLAVDGLVLGRSERWFVGAGEAAILLRNLTERTYLW